MDLIHDLSTPSPALDPISFGIVSVFGSSFHILQPLVVPGFALSHHHHHQMASSSGIMQQTSSLLSPNLNNNNISISDLANISGFTSSQLNVVQGLQNNSNNLKNILDNPLMISSSSSSCSANNRYRSNTSLSFYYDRNYYEERKYYYPTLSFPFPFRHYSHSMLQMRDMGRDRDRGIIGHRRQQQQLPQEQ